MTPIKEARRAKILTLAFDVIAAIAAMGFAVVVRWWVAGNVIVPEAWRMAAGASLVFGASAGTAFVLMKVHQQVWRHAGWTDVLRITQAVALAGLIFLPIMFLMNRLNNFPRASILIALPVWLAIILGGRMIALFRSTRRPLQIFEMPRKDAPRALMVGDGERVVDVLRNMARAPDGMPVRILGLIESNGANPGRAIRGVPVMGGMADLGKAIDLLSIRYGAPPLVAVVGSARSRETMREILAITSERSAEIMALGEGEGGEIFMPARPADLLSRPERQLDITPVRKLVSGANVFVTGAGGTIGSELVRQCAALEPASITLFEACEYNLYDINRTLRQVHPNLPIHPVLGNVRDESRVRDALTTYEPDIVIHAAALKHVPLMEENVCEAILTNVGGAQIVARLAAQAGVKRFVFISTDKAVDPDNVMGATKRLAEMTIERTAKASGMATAMVRFGNVLGSSGSVVPLFEQQIADGGPVTVTHKDVTRYFMTVEEASSLVLQATALQEVEGDVGLFVLDMGEPVRIEALAKSMIRMKGLVPGKDIKIEHSGLRPGEKLHEVLAYGHEAILPTDVDGVMKVSGANGFADQFDGKLEKLLTLAAQRRRGEALAMLVLLVPDYEADKDAVA